MPSEERSRKSIDDAQRQSDLLTALAAIGLGALAAYLIVKRLPVGGRTLEDILAQRLPQARRRRCA